MTCDEICGLIMITCGIICILTGIFLFTNFFLVIMLISGTTLNLGGYYALTDRTKSS